MNYKPYKHLPPFKGMVLQNFPFIEEDFDAITNYQLLCKVVEYLKLVIDNEKIVEENVTYLYNAFVELKNYVENYFNNLDVQEEINNKLDEMASDGTLENIVKDYLNTKCEFIFPGRWGYNTSGNSNIIKYKDKVILFDTNHAGVYSYLKLMLADYNITHIDYIIISHFDGDHIGNMESLITDGYIDTNTKYFHPACPSEIYSQETINLYNTIEYMCELRNIESIIPTEKQILSIYDDFSLKFGNCDTTYTIANYTSPNQASMVVEVNHNGFKSLFTGDSQPITLKRLYDTNFITSEIQLYTIPHHAINSGTYTPFYEIIRPKFAIAQTQMTDFNLNKLVQNADSSILNDMGCVNYYSCLNQDNLYFIEQMGTINCLKGVPHATVGKYASVTNIYVNANVSNDAIQDGTESHPYRDLSEAVGCIADYPNRHINIILAPGHYGTGNPAGSTGLKNRINIMNWKNILTITTSGNNTDTFIDDGISINNCFKVKIENITIYSTETRSYGAYINNSNVYFKDCIFKSDTTTKRDYGIWLNEWSKAEIIGCTFEYLINAISCRTYGYVNLHYCSFNNLTRIFDADSTSNIIIHSNNVIDYSTIDNINNYSSGNRINSKIIRPVEIPFSVMTGDISLPFIINNVYNFIEFEYELRYNNEQVGRNKKICSLKDTSSFIISDFNLQANGYVKFFSCLININYTLGKLTISRNTSSNLIASTGTMTTHTPADAETDDYGIKLVNIKLY